ncbi:glycosyltransferase [Clostridium perfringens]|uniref:glycosyltransferase n=1 Tax=Clostridium perfringens TaxID=1502 RepID=UPI001DF23A85|nr:glycosyltransferase [Clostridium perfringens]
MKDLEYLDKNCFKYFFDNLNIPLSYKEKIYGILENIDVSHLISNKVYDYIDITKYLNKLANLNMKKTTLSIVYIVKNEELYIKKSIKKSLKIADEIIVFDTGSTDSTINILESINSSKIKIINGKWNDNFSLARNEANSYATSDWILTMDADEIIDFKNNTIKSILSFLNNFPISDNSVFNLTLSCGKNLFKAGRLVKNKHIFYYKGKVHETYVNKISNFSYPHINLNLTIKYINRQSYNKIQYYNKLLLDTMEQYPDEQRWFFLYLRDNIETININQLELIVNNCILINPNKPLNTSNIKLDYYTHGLFIIILRKFLIEEELNKFSIYLTLAKEFFNSLDLIYLEYIYNEMKIKQQQKDLLDKFLIQYDNLPTKREFFDENYIDSLLGLFLLNNGYISEAKKIFNNIFLNNPNMSCFKDNYIKEIL